jgi:hypothetical protein
VPTFQLLPFQEYPTGERAAQRAIPSGLTVATFAIDVSQMTDPAQSYDVLLDLSLDGGLSFASQFPDGQVPATYGSFPWRVHRVGGVFLDRNGVPFTSHTMRVPLPAPTNPNRVGRAALTINAVPITLGATIAV